MTYKMLREENAALHQQVALQTQMTPIIAQHVGVLAEWYELLDFDPPEDVAKAMWLLINVFPSNEEVADERPEDSDV